MRYFIHEENMERLEKRIKTISNKCKKYNCSFEYSVVGEKFEEVNGETVRFVEVETSGEAKMNGWKFVATVEHTEQGNIVRGYDNEIEIPVRFTTTEPICEHCNSKRRRKDTYIVMNEETGEFKQVGKSCLKDFTNGLSAEEVASWISLFDEMIKGEAPMGTGFKTYFETEEMARYMAECVLKFGYHKSESMEATKYMARYIRDVVRGHRDKELEERINEVGFNADSEEATELSENALRWAKEVTEDSGYLYNIKLVANMKYVEKRHFGFLASIIPSYQKEMKRLEEERQKEEERKARPESKHVGSVGDKVEVKIYNCRLLTSWETQWGFTNLYEITDAEGNVYTWKTSKSIDSEHKTIKGTVKAHNEFRGVMQTELTRCKTE